MTAIYVPDATREPAAYVTTLLDILGDRDPVATLRATHGELTNLIGRGTQEQLRSRPADGGWSAEEIVGHLVDSEIAYSLRWRLMLTKDRPGYPAHDDRALVALPKPPLEHVLALFGELRTYDVWLLEHVARDDWQRIGVHEEQGPETVERNLRKLAAHDLAHLNQIERALADGSGHSR